MNDGAPFRQRRTDFRIMLRPPPDAPPFPAQKLIPPRNDAAFPVRVQIGCFFFQPLRQRNIVMVSHRQIIARRHFHQPVPASGNAQISLIAKIFYPRVIIRCYNRLRRPVFGTVVQNQEFKILRRLVQYALDRLPQKRFRRLINRHQNGNFRHLRLSS